MELVTALTSTKNQIDKVDRFEFDGTLNTLTVYFCKSIEISGERGDSSLDISMPLMIPIDLISDALQVIHQKALELRATQLDSLAKNLLIKKEPDYKYFYGELLMTELFTIARHKADQNLQVNTAYTDFALALTNSIVGNINSIALQICLNRMLAVLGDSVQAQHLKDLNNLVAKHKIPILISETALSAQET